MPIITISRGLKSSGEMLAEQVGERLGAEVVSREMLMESAREWGFSDRFWTELREGQIPRFMRKMTPQHKQYLHFLQIKLYEYAETGSLVYHGNAGQFLLGNIPCVLRVKLIAPFDYRVKSSMEKLNLNRKDAEVYLKRIDESRLRWMKFLYGADWNDPLLYDVIINRGRVTVENAAEVIALMSLQEQFQVKEDCMRIIRNASLEGRIAAALIANPRTQSLRLLIQADDGVVNLTGPVEAERVRQVALEIIRGVEGVNSIHDDMTIKKLSPLPTQGQI